MDDQQTPGTSKSVSLKNAALISGFGLLLMVLTAPVAEMYLMPRLIDYGDAGQTLENLVANKELLIYSIFLYLVTFIADVLVAWGLYIFFKPADKNLSLLAAWFRLVYTALALVGLFNLTKVLQLISGDPAQIEAGQVIFYLRSFQTDWGLAFFFFAICLMLLGYLSIKATYVPNIVGYMVFIAGLGYFFNSLQPYFFPNMDTTFLMITFFGELVLMFWLLIKGWRINLPLTDTRM